MKMPPLTESRAGGPPCSPYDRKVEALRFSLSGNLHDEAELDVRRGTQNTMWEGKHQI